MSIINGNWFSIEEDKEVEFVNEDVPIISNISNITNINTHNTLNANTLNLNNTNDKIKELENRIKELELSTDNSNQKIKELESLCNKITNENLKLINRILEAEISIERTKNILLRKNISFPFTPLTSKFL